MIENIDRGAILIGKMRHFFEAPAPVGEGRVSPPATAGLSRPHAGWITA
jgi:hypothetical protein